MCPLNPHKWRFTWEAQSHTPNLKLFLFNSNTKPSIDCQNLEVHFNLPKSQLLLNWIQDDNKVSIRVFVPKVLIDPDSPVNFRPLDYHIEVKLVLLLPVDHPILSNLNLSDDGENTGVFYSIKPLDIESDLKSLSSMGEVDFYCRSCSTRLTRTPIRRFTEMPSVDWREMADNWFGACCCSFGGISEKLVNRYADAYTCPKGVCLLSSTTVILCKDDLVGCEFADCSGIQKCGPRRGVSAHDGLSEETIAFGSILRSDSSFGCHIGEVDADGTLTSSHLALDNHTEILKYKASEEEPNVNRLSYDPLESYLSENESAHGCYNSSHHSDEYFEARAHKVSKLSLRDHKTNEAMEAMANQTSLLNGFLGNVFMAKSYNLSTDINWKQFLCPHCSTLLGAYPCGDGDGPIDKGVRIFKCYLSTSLPVGGSSDPFRKYTLEKMFANQLIESAKDELSFRTVIRDLTTKSPMLQIILLNPNSWCCSGSCSDGEYSVESVSKLELCPAIKLLFANCSNDKDLQLRVLEDWVTKNLADEVYMMPHLIEELTETITSMKDQLPPSCASFQGLSLSFILR